MPYGGRSHLPIWIAIELWDFGLLSYAYSGLKYADQAAIAQRFGIHDNTVMRSWLRCLNYVRNVIAHHGRLWNLNLTDNPRLPKKGEISAFDPLILIPNVSTRMYSVCCVLSHLSQVINPTCPWIGDMRELVKNFPIMKHASPRDMGFPPDWEQHDFWK